MHTMKKKAHLNTWYGITINICHDFKALELGVKPVAQWPPSDLILLKKDGVSMCFEEEPEEWKNITTVLHAMQR